MSRSVVGATALAVMLATGGGCSGKGGGTDPNNGGVAGDLDPGAVRAKLSVCHGYSVESTVGYTLAAEKSLLGEARSCIAAATACDQVLRCVGEESVASCDMTHGCVAGSAIHCESLPDGSGVQFTNDCSADPSGNTQCFDSGESDYAGCGASSCDETLPETCDGNVAVLCLQGKQFRQDCAPQAKSCRLFNADQNAFCAMAEACSADHCEGDQVVTCLGGFAYEKLDCGTRTPDGTCQVTARGAHCQARNPSPECASTAGYRSSCDGDLAVSCVLGAKVTTSCTAVPGAHCVEVDGDLARCQL